MALDTGVLLHQLEQFFLMIATGFAAYKLRLMDGPMHDMLCRALLRVVVPALLFSMIASSGEAASGALIRPLLLGGALLYALSMSLGWLLAKLFRFTGDAESVQIGLTAFCSVGFFGVPLAVSLLGKVGALALGLYVILDSGVVWTVGVRLAQPHGAAAPGWRTSLMRMANPSSIAVLLGLLYLLSGLPSENIVLEAAATVGGSSTALAMLCIGGSIARADVRALLAGWRSLGIALTKMLLLPVGLWYSMAALGVYRPAAVALTLICALPCSSTFAILCRDAGSTAADYAASASILTALCSLGTVPLVALLCGW